MARAITLAELLFATSLICLVVVSAGALYINATGYISSFGAQVQMQNQANIALQEIIEDIHLAADVEKLSDSSIEITPITGESFQYLQSNSYIMRDIEIIATGVKELRFDEPIVNPNTQRKSLQINLTMEGKSGLADLDFVTTVTLRKYE